MDSVDQGQENHGGLSVSSSVMTLAIQRCGQQSHFLGALKKVALVSTVLVLQACGILTKESIYEGLRSQEKIKEAGQSVLPAPLPSYQDYEAERERLKKGN